MEVVYTIGGVLGFMFVVLVIAPRLIKRSSSQPGSRRGGGSVDVRPASPEDVIEPTSDKLE